MSKPAENAAHRKKGHFWMETNLNISYELIGTHQERPDGEKKETAI